MLRLKYGGLNLVDSDIRFTNKNLASLIGLGFGGGIVAGAFGLGGGTISDSFNYGTTALSVGSNGFVFSDL